jgi:hypothetical protein
MRLFILLWFWYHEFMHHMNINVGIAVPNVMFLTFKFETHIWQSWVATCNDYYIPNGCQILEAKSEGRPFKIARSDRLWFPKSQQKHCPLRRCLTCHTHLVNAACENQCMKVDEWDRWVTHEMGITAFPTAPCGIGVYQSKNIYRVPQK